MIYNIYEKSIFGCTLLFSFFAIIVNAGPNITSLYKVIKYNGIILTDNLGNSIGTTGGSLILGPTTVYSIYYGTVSDTKKKLISNFINGISTTSWWSILNIYTETIWSSDFGGYTSDLSQTTLLTEIPIDYPTSRCTSGRITPKNCQEGLWHGINLKISGKPQHLMTRKQRETRFFI